jgi:hypothetical protein
MARIEDLFDDKHVMFSFDPEDEALVLRFSDAPVGFICGAPKLVGFSMTPFGPRPLFEPRVATALWRGELMMYDGAQVALPLADTRAILTEVNFN